MLTVLHGHSLAKLREMPDEAVHCFVTSPPFWGLRDYSVPPQVWGGDTACEHVWGEWTEKHSEREVVSSGKTRTSDRSFGGDATRKFNGNHQKHTAGSFCQKCDAWFGDLGLEPSPELYVRNLVMVLHEARRVLRSDGTLWLNLGDSYATGAGAVGNCPGGGKQGDAWKGNRGSRGGSAKQPHTGSAIGPLVQPNRMPIAGLKPKDLVGIPWRVAFALQGDGWWLRSDIIWNKPNPMPESITDRPTKSHEYIFLLTKSERYFYDAEAIKEPAAPSSLARWDQNIDAQLGSDRVPGKTDGNMKAVGGPRVPSGGYGHGAGRNDGDNNPSGGWCESAMRNKRSVWTITTQPYSDAHFATFPKELPKLCILGGTSAKGCCSKCGAPWERIVELGEPDLEHQRACGGDFNGEYNGTATKDFLTAKAQNASEVKARILRGMVDRKTTGWQPTCKCKNAKIIPCTVCDPFGGSGTTGEVAVELGRNAVLIELNEKYLPLINRRCDVTPGLALA